MFRLAVLTALTLGLSLVVSNVTLPVSAAPIGCADPGTGVCDITALEAEQDNSPASTIVVDTLSGAAADDGLCSLREAITAANEDITVDTCVGTDGADTITFSVTGTINLFPTNGPLPDVTTEITIDGDVDGDGAGDITISGTAFVGVPIAGHVYVASTGALTLKNLTLTNGRATGGGSIRNDGDLTIINSTLSGNAATGSGGAILNRGTGTVHIEGSTLSGNQALPPQAGSPGLGGAIFSDGSEVTILDSTLSGNGVNSAGTPGTSQGGAIFIGAGGLTVTDTEFRDNGALVGGGALYIGGTGLLSGVTLSGNSVNSFSAASATGGAILNLGELTLTGSTLADNRAASDGGAIRNAGNLTIGSTTIAGNTSDGLGGGISSLGPLEIFNSTISGNTAHGNLGGGLYHQNGTATLTNVTIAKNSATGITASGGGIGSFAAVQMTIINTIVADNLSTIMGSRNCSVGAFHTDSSHNLADDVSCGASATVVDLVELALGELTANGGPTETHLPGPGSAAFEAGDNTVCADSPIDGVDQRGELRPQPDNTACDVGAVEVEQDSPPPSQVVTTDFDAPDHVGACTLRDAMTTNLTGGTTGGCEPSDDGVIRFHDDLGAATISLAYTLPDVTGGASIAIDGGGDITIDSGRNQHFVVADDASLSLESISLVGGEIVGLGGSIHNSGELSLIDATVTDNLSWYGGGAIYNGATAVLSISGSVISDNVANDFLENSQVHGGAIHNDGGTVTITASTLSGNTASWYGGAIYNANEGQVTIDGESEILDNGPNIDNPGRSTDQGGGIYNAAGSTVTIEGNSLVKGNVATEIGGGIDNRGVLSVTDSSVIENVARAAMSDGDEAEGGGLANSGTATITDSTFDGNTAARWGGGIYNQGTLTLTGGSVVNNALDGDSQVGGGGFANSGGTVNVTGTEFRGNSATLASAVVNESGEVTLTSVTIDDNPSQFSAISNIGDMTILSSAIIGNVASGNIGGTIINNVVPGDRAGELAIINTTISGNSAAAGGAIYNQGLLQLLNTTIAANTVTGADGAAVVSVVFAALPEATTEFANTIVTSTTGGANCGGDAPVTGTAGSNLTDDGSCSAALFEQGDADLEPLALNGGLTRNHLPGPNSDAINAGDNTVCQEEPVNGVDQRDVTRPQGADCDIGAVEVEQDDAPPLNTEVTTVVDAENYAEACTLRDAIRANLDDAARGGCQPSGNNTVTFADVLDGDDGSRVITLNGNQLPTITGEIIIDGGELRVTLDADGRNRHVEVDGTGDLTVRDLTITNGRAGDNSSGGVIRRNRGGAILVTGGRLTVEGSVLSNNSARYAGTIYLVDSNPTVTILDSTLTNNSAENDGGAIRVESSTATLTATNTTFSGNSVPGETSAGDAIYVSSAESVTLTNVTTWGTPADHVGLNLHGEVTIRNTIADSCTFRSAAVGSNNYAPTGSRCAGTGRGFTEHADLLLGELDDNGGSTETHLPAAGSPVIDGGGNAFCPEVDQRGEPRPFNATGRPEAQCDAGSVEVQEFAGANISGLVTLQGRMDFSGITIAIYEGDELLASTTTDASGAYSFSAPPASTVTRYAVKPGYLRASSDVELAAGENAFAQIQLRSGDATGDANIDILDLSLIATYYQDFAAFSPSDGPETVPGPVQAVTPDLNGDGEVTILDLSVASANYRTLGPADWP